MPNEGVPKEAALNPKAGFSSFPLSTESFELESTPDFVLSLPSFVVDMLPLMVLEPAEPKMELGELENDALEPVLRDCVVLMLLDGFPKGMDPEESDGTVGFATDGVAKEKDDAALGGLLFINLNALSEGGVDGEGPNGDPTAALELELTAVVGVVVVLPGGGPNLEASVAPDFSVNDDAFLGAATPQKPTIKELSSCKHEYTWTVQTGGRFCKTRLG